MESVEDIMEKEIIKKDVNMTPEDLYIFQKSYMKKSVNLSIIIVAAIIAVVIMLIILTSDTDLTEKLMRLALLFIIPSVIILLIFSTLKKASQNAFKENKLINQTQHFTISDEYIEVESGSGNAKIKWTDLYKAEELKECFLLFLSKQQAYVISKRYFEENETEMKLMRSFISHAPVPKETKNYAKILLIGSIVSISIFILIFVFTTLVMLFL